VFCRVVFVGGSQGTSPSLDLTFPPTGLSENLGGMERERGGKGEREGWGDHMSYSPPTGFCLKYHLVFCLLVVLARLSVPVQVIDWKDSSPK